MGGNYNEEMLEKFVSDMMNEKGVELGDYERVEERDRLVDMLNEKIEGATVDALPEEKAQALEKLIDEKGDNLTENEVAAVVYGSQGEINSAVEKAMAEFREGYLKGEIK